MSTRSYRLVIAVFIAFIFASLNIYPVLYGASIAPDSRIYLGTGHFFADYLNYLAIVAQVTRGHWQSVNPFTSEPLSGYWVVAWPYLFAGNLGRLVGFTPQVCYWLAVFILGLAVVLAAYWLLAKICRWPTAALIIYLTTCGFYLLGLNPLFVKLYPFNWYYNVLSFSRISNIPHQMLSSVLTSFLFVVFYYWQKDLPKIGINRKGIIVWGSFTLICLVLLTGMPIRLVYLLPSVFFGLLFSFFQKKGFDFKNLSGFMPQVGFFVLLLIGLVLFSQVARADFAGAYFPEVLKWEREQMQVVGLWEFIRGSGPVFIMAVIGLIVLFSRKSGALLSPVLLAGLLASILSYGLFFTKISLFFDNHNSRFLFSEAYIFMSVVVTEWLGAAKKKIYLAIGVAFLVLFSILPFWAFIKEKTAKLVTDNPFEYADKKVVAAFDYLRQSDSQAIVLTPPDFQPRLTLPVFADNRLYLGRWLSTIDYENKEAKVKEFYSCHTSTSGQVQFLRENNIGWFILSDLDEPTSFSRWFWQHCGVASIPLELKFKNEKLEIYQVEDNFN